MNLLKATECLRRTRRKKIIYYIQNLTVIDIKVFQLVLQEECKDADDIDFRSKSSKRTRYCRWSQKRHLRSLVVFNKEEFSE